MPWSYFFIFRFLLRSIQLSREIIAVANNIRLRISSRIKRKTGGCLSSGSGFLNLRIYPKIVKINTITAIAKLKIIVEMLSI